MRKRTMLISVGIVISIAAVAAVLMVSPLGTPVVSAVQNIFTGLGNVKDIQYGNKKVLKVLYRGQVVWEREPDGPTDGTAMQTITSATCPTTRIRAYDARDNHSYYVQKLADGKCWMLTNLAYAGDGNTTYGDTTTLPASTTSGYIGGSLDNAYTTKGWAQPGGTMFTTEPTNPSTTTGSGGQYGYLYNWCATMGGQSNACSSSISTQPNQGVNAGSGANNNLNICPKGWRLPTGGSGGEFVALNNAVNGGATNTDAGLRNAWLGVYSGYYDSGLNSQGSYGRYWSSTVNNAYGAYDLYFRSSNVYPTNAYNKYVGLAVRCIAD